jgi:CheY-like chemotaxis protein
MMPRMDGFEFVAELRKQPGWRAVPIIVLTAKTLTNEDRLVLQGHVQKVIQKGDFHHSELLVELRDIVAEAVQRTRAVEAGAHVEI